MRTLIAASMIAVLAGATMADAATQKKAPATSQPQTTSSTVQPPAARKAPAPFKWHHRNQFTG
ncbi:hypothetical protein [Rhizobium sp. CSW-27]|uniref:hypothetical protein n=1 Tax=Rhizobium sp. CSW-27 TaxID=2839985 RepID=UPI001C0159A5|nr:hypothetical protein [Rhizobium sp. CSW-27]MBT9370966.1 hypothetical protein [Rhizobium sp. CSW-27]